MLKFKKSDLRFLTLTFNEKVEAENFLAATPASLREGQYQRFAASMQLMASSTRNLLGCGAVVFMALGGINAWYGQWAKGAATEAGAVALFTVAASRHRKARFYGEVLQHLDVSGISGARNFVKAKAEAAQP